MTKLEIIGAVVGSSVSLLIALILSIIATVRATKKNKKLTIDMSIFKKEFKSVIHKLATGTISSYNCGEDTFATHLKQEYQLPPKDEVKTPEPKKPEKAKLPNQFLEDIK